MSLSRARVLAVGYLHWLFWQPWRLWLFIAVIAVSSALALWASSEQLARYIGTFLQLLGTGQALWALGKIGRLFKVPSPWSIFVLWWKARPGRNVTVGLTGQASMFLTGHAPSVRIDYAMGPQHASADARFSAIEENIRQLRKEIDEAAARHASELADTRRVIDERFRTSDTVIAEVAAKLRESQAGAIWQAAFALSLIFVGLLICGFAPDIGAP